MRTPRRKSVVDRLEEVGRRRLSLPATPLGPSGPTDWGLVTVTELEALAPSKGDRAHLLLGDGIGRVWHLIADGDPKATGRRWAFEGGEPLREEDTGTRETTSTTYQTTGAPSVSAPIAGQYRVAWGANRAGPGNVAAGDSGAQLCVFKAGVETALHLEIRIDNQHRGNPVVSQRYETATKGQALQSRYKANNANGARVIRGFIEITPVRVA